jgi:L-glutamine-phosphate cytidylyltransferase
MKAIIIGAGRGSRLMPTTADTPKCFAEVQNRRILDWTIDAFKQNGITNIHFIGGYQIEKVKAAYPQFSFFHNQDWPNNNILASLMHAEPAMNEEFICCYSDILFTPTVVQGILSSKDDISVVVDTKWKDRYVHRSQHPPTDAEKVTVKNGKVTKIHRDIEENEAHGEYIGVAKFSKAGASALREHYHQCRKSFDGKPFREAKEFKKAYLIHLLQDMIEKGVLMTHVDTPGGYMEIDTQEDFELARQSWK